MVRRASARRLLTYELARSVARWPAQRSRAQHKIRPVVETILDGLEKAEDGFQVRIAHMHWLISQMMKNGQQFGKITIVIKPASSAKL